MLWANAAIPSSSNEICRLRMIFLMDSALEGFTNWMFFSLSLASFVKRVSRGSIVSEIETETFSAG